MIKEKTKGFQNPEGKRVSFFFLIHMHKFNVLTCAYTQSDMMEGTWLSESLHVAQSVHPFHVSYM